MSDATRDLQPIEATRRAIDEVDLPDEHLLDTLLAKGREVRALVPDCVGISIGVIDQGVTFTLVTSNAEIATLDAVQYLTGGPCVHGAHVGEVIQFELDEPLTEDSWRLFAVASAARGVHSTLTLPILSDRGDGAVVGSVNLYAASARAFEGQHETIAEIFGGWAPGAVTNADLPFRTRLEAQRAPQVLRERQVVDTAIGMIAASYGIAIGEAEDLLEETATRAGVDPLELAETVIEAGTAMEDDE